MKWRLIGPQELPERHKNKSFSLDSRYPLYFSKGKQKCNDRQQGPLLLPN